MSLTPSEQLLHTHKHLKAKLRYIIRLAMLPFLVIWGSTLRGPVCGTFLCKSAGYLPTILYITLFFKGAPKKMEPPEQTKVAQYYLVRCGSNGVGTIWQYYLGSLIEYHGMRHVV